MAKLHLEHEKLKMEQEIEHEKLKMEQEIEHEKLKMEQEVELKRIDSQERQAKLDSDANLRANLNSEN